MDKKKRLKELKRLFTTPENQLLPSEFKTFSVLHKRVEELVGRAVWTHEFAFPELLYHEIESGEKGNPFGEALVRATGLTKSKKAIIITLNEEEGITVGFKVVGKLGLSKKEDTNIE